jgi:transcriptional regulator with GAF, ATPase, and Fis domain
MINSILDLLSEIVRDNIELSLKKKELNSIKPNVEENLTEEYTKTAKEIYLTVYADGLLATLLDLAFKMTNAECGSIMVKDAGEDSFTIKVSRGLDPAIAQNTKIKLGEGISGIAARENASFVIQGTEGDNRIKHLLKKPDIKEALVMPLTNKEQVFGVLNLHTKKEGTGLTNSLNNLKYLSELLSSAL